MGPICVGFQLKSVPLFPHFVDMWCRRIATEISLILWFSIRNLSCILVDSVESWTFFFVCLESNSEIKSAKDYVFYRILISMIQFFDVRRECQLWENLRIMRFQISLWHRQCSSLNRIFPPRLILWQTKSIICEIFSKISIKMRRWKCSISLWIANFFVSFTTYDEWLRGGKSKLKIMNSNLHTQFGWGWMEVLSTRLLNYRKSCNRCRKISCCHCYSVSKGWRMIKVKLSSSRKSKITFCANNITLTSFRCLPFL